MYPKIIAKNGTLYSCMVHFFVRLNHFEAKILLRSKQNRILKILNQIFIMTLAKCCFMKEEIFKDATFVCISLFWALRYWFLDELFLLHVLLPELLFPLDCWLEYSHFSNWFILYIFDISVSKSIKNEHESITKISI